MNSQPKYTTLVKALSELHHATLFGVFNAMSRKEIDDSPCHLEIERLCDRAEKLLKRVRASRPDENPPFAAPIG